MSRIKGISTVPDSTHRGSERSEWRREAYTMAFYLAICLMAALVTLDGDSHPRTLAIIWGVTIGLALAHIFAFELAGRLVEGVSMIRSVKGGLVGAQVVGAVSVAVVATIPVLIFEASTEVYAARYALSGLIGIAAYSFGRNRGASVARCVTFAVVVVGVATAIAFIKNALGGH